MESQFLLIIERASIQVSRAQDQEEGQRGRKGRGYVKENVPRLLTKMLQICFARFQNVVHAHEILLTHLQRVKRMYKGGSVCQSVSPSVSCLVCLSVGLSMCQLFGLSFSHSVCQ